MQRNETNENVLPYLTNKFNFWSVHGILNTSGLFQSKYVHASIYRQKIELTTYIYISYYQSSINFHLTWLVLQIFWIKSDLTEVSE